MFRIRVPATSANLGPGFDSLGIALKIYNDFYFRKTPGRLEIRLQTEDGDLLELPLEDNYLYLALKELYALCGAPLTGLKIEGRLAIPLARGLGSSATAIIAGLAAGNRLLGCPFTEKEILQLALKLEGHPDNIVPALKGGFIINLLNGDEITYKKIALAEELQIVLAVPSLQLKTASLRKVLPEMIPLGDVVFNQSRTALLAVSLAEGDLDNLALAMEDRLHQDYRSPLIPGFKKAVNQAYRAGALGAALSGAGPTVIALTRNKAGQIGEAMVEAFRDEGIDSSYLITTIDNHGLYYQELNDENRGGIDYE